MKGYRIARALKFLLFGAVAVTLFSGVVMGLWNWLMPAVFGLRAITFWQALGLLVPAGSCSVVSADRDEGCTGGTG